MEKETLEIELTEISLSVKNSAIHSLRRKDLHRRAARVFKDGAVGLAASQGEIPFSNLFKKARNALTLGVGWDYALPENRVYAGDITQGLTAVTEENLLDLGEDILKELANRNPDFIFSNQIRGRRRHVALKNSRGTSLSLRTQRTEVSLLFKHRESTNIIDGFLDASSLRKINTNEYVRRYTEILEGYRTLKKMNSGRKKVIFLDEEILFRKFHEILRGDRHFQGASLLSNKLGKRVFSDDFTLYDSNNLQRQGHFSPFDSEGVMRQRSNFPLVQDGIFRNVIFDLRNAAKYKKKSTGNGYRAYSRNPDIHFNALRVKRGQKTLDELLGGDEALLVLVASGGDFLDNGDFSTPVQLSYIYRDGAIRGRAPQLTVRSNLLEMFGKDLLGVSRDSFLSNWVNPYLVMEMETKVH